MNFKKTQYFSKLKRLRGKLGIFEVLIGLLILLVLLFVMVLTRSKKEWVRAEIKISSSSWWQTYYNSPPFWLGESINIGDQEYDSMGNKIAEVLNIKEYELNSSGVEPTTRKDFYLTVNLKIERDGRTSKLKFNNQPLEIGAPIEMHLSNTYVLGIVIFVEGIPDPRETEELIIEGVWLDIFPWSAEAIKVGGKMKDGTGETVAEILEKRVELAEKTIETWQGNLVVSRDPLKRDIYLKIKLLVRKQGDNYYFREDQKVKVGENLFIHLPEIDVEWVSVLKVFDKEGKQLY